MSSPLLIKFLICFFIVVVIYQIFLAHFTSNVEGLENGTYQEYDDKDPNNQMILIQKNSGNIEVLRKQMDGVMGLSKDVQDLSGNFAILKSQVNGMFQAQQDAAAQNYPSSTPEISGAFDDTPDNVETEVVVSPQEEI